MNVIDQSFQVHTTLDSLRANVPENILPKEYGGTIPMDDMISKYINVYFKFCITSIFYINTSFLGLKISSPY